jgi:hypothetical protein
VAAYNELGNCLTSAPIAINVTNYLIWTPVGGGVSTTQNGTVLVFNNSAAGAYAYASISGVPNGYQVNMLTPAGGQSSFTWEVISTTSGNFVNWGLDTDNTSWLVYQSENQNGHLNNVIGSGVNLPLLHTSNGSWSDNYWTLGLSGNVQFEVICRGTLTVGPFTVVP